MDKQLYKPFKSKIEGKKFSVYVKGPTGNPRLIHFGDSNYRDFRSGASEARRRAYLKRAGGLMKMKDGKRIRAVDDKDSPAYWSYRYLWKGK